LWFFYYKKNKLNTGNLKDVVFIEGNFVANYRRSLLSLVFFFKINYSFNSNTALFITILIPSENMFVNKLKNISLINNELILSFKKKEAQRISFLEIETIYIQVKRTGFLYILLFIVFSVSLEGFVFWFSGFDFILLSPMMLIFLGVIKLNKHKRYDLIVFFKSGNSVIHPIPLKLKYQAIDVINKLPKEKVKRQKFKY
jgi:hypothetical protein